MINTLSILLISTAIAPSNKPESRYSIVKSTAEAGPAPTQELVTNPQHSPATLQARAALKLKLEQTQETRGASRKTLKLDESARVASARERCQLISEQLQQEQKLEMDFDSIACSAICHTLEASGSPSVCQILDILTDTKSIIHLRIKGLTEQRKMVDVIENPGIDARRRARGGIISLTPKSAAQGLRWLGGQTFRNRAIKADQIWSTGSGEIEGLFKEIYGHLGTLNGGLYDRTALIALIGRGRISFPVRDIKKREEMLETIKAIAAELESLKDKTD